MLDLTEVWKCLYVFTGATKIEHDLIGEKSVSKCQERGCFVKRVRYNISMSQIAALASLSNNCEQHIRVSQFLFSFLVLVF